MSEVLDKIKSRRSIRKYKPDPVPQELLDQIIEAGLYAANGKGFQCVEWDLRVVKCICVL